MLYIDLDELPQLFNPFWLWSKDKFNLASFNSKDYLAHSEKDIKQAIYQQVEKQYQVKPSGPVRMLTHLRYFGYCFNPVTFYYCFDESDNNIEFIVAQVSNTPWNQKHCYVLDNRQQKLQIADSTIIRSQMQKQFHVSPFLPMDMTYQWQIGYPAEKLSVFIENYQNDKKVFDATLLMHEKTINSFNLAKALMQFPFVTGKVIFAIYWNALILWIKGMTYYPNLSSSNR